MIAVYSTVVPSNFHTNVAGTLLFASLAAKTTGHLTWVDPVEKVNMFNAVPPVSKFNQQQSCKAKRRIANIGCQFSKTLRFSPQEILLFPP